jgi:hypothetical protein
MSSHDRSTVRLGRIAHTRSGDKGTGANVGVIAHSDATYKLLCDQVTADRVEQFFRPRGVVRVVRHELPNLRALNFVLEGVLGRITRVDAQGKALGQALLEMPVDVPARVLRFIEIGVDHE